MTAKTILLAALLTALLPALAPALPRGLDGQAHAQETGEDEAGPDQDGAAPPDAPSEAPFMAPLQRLATILGSLSFLRTLCDDPDAETWREQMQAIIDAQKPGDADRRRLIAQFNSGYRGFESSYRTCTPAARTAVHRFHDEGLELSREIIARYGN